jgi:hypothetical protein
MQSTRLPYRRLDVLIGQPAPSHFAQGAPYSCDADTERKSIEKNEKRRMVQIVLVEADSALSQRNRIAVTYICQ